MLPNQDLMWFLVEEPDNFIPAPLEENKSEIKIDQVESSGGLSTDGAVSYDDHLSKIFKCSIDLADLLENSKLVAMPIILCFI